MSKKTLSSRRHRQSRTITKVLAGLVLLVTVALASLILFVLHMGGVKQILEDELNGLSTRITAAVGSAQIEFSASLAPVSIVARDISLTVGDDTLLLPLARAGFGIKSFFLGRPEELALDGLTIDLVRDEDGWAASPSLMLVNELAMPGDAGSRDASAAVPSSGSFAGVQQVMLGADRITIRNRGNGDLLPLEFVDVDVALTANQVNGVGGRITAHRQIDGRPAGRVSAQFTGWPGQGEVLLDMSLANFNLQGVSAYFDGLPDLTENLGALSGTARAAVSDSALTRLDLNARASNGRFALPGSGKIAPFTNADATLSYQRQGNILRVENISIELADNSILQLSGEVLNIHDDRPIFRGDFQASRISVQTLYDDWPKSVAARAKAALEQRFSGGFFTDVNFAFVGAIDQNTGIISLSKLDMKAGFNGIRMDVSGGQYRRLVGTIDGALSLNLDSGGQVRDMGFDFALNDGTLLLADHESAVDVDRLSLSAALKDSVLEVTTFDLALSKKGSVAVNGQLVLAPDWSPQSLDLTMASGDMDISLFHAIWPEWAVSPARNWVKNKIPTGQVNSASFSLSSLFEESGPSLVSMEGNVALNGAQIALGGTIPVFESVAAVVTLDRDRADVVIGAGQVNDLSVQRGRVTITPLMGDAKPRAHAEMALKGGVETAVNIAAGFGLTNVGVFDLGQLKAGGEIEVTIDASFPVYGEVNIGEVDFAARAAISAGRFDGLPFDASIDRAELVAEIDAERIDVTGSADVMGVPGNFSFVSDSGTGDVEFIGRALPSAEMTQRLATFTNLELGGRTGGTIVMRSDSRFTNMKIGMAMDMRGASVNVPVINWAKLPSEKGSAKMTFSIQNGRIRSLDDIDISMGSLAATGQVALTETGSVRAALFDRVVWPGNDLREVIIEQGSAGVWEIGANARVIDLVPLRQNAGVGAGRPIRFDVTADQIVIGQNIVLRGHIEGDKQSNGGGKALFSGNLLHEGKTIISESSMTLRFGKDGEFLSGAGLIGGAETTIAYTDRNGGTPSLVLTSRNGGRMLAGLGITDTISSGQVVLTNRFVGGGFDEFDTEIHITDFNVLEAPGALKAFSVLGPIGLYNLVEGEGTRFAWGEAKFEKRGSLIRLNPVRAGGDAIAVSMVGTYDTNTRKVDVGGNLVPASFLSKFVGAIPLVGQLLTGTDSSGIFVTQFQMQGDVDDPSTNVNAASLVPGVLRDFISPDWLGREAERVLGSDNATN